MVCFQSTHTSVALFGFVVVAVGTAVTDWLGIVMLIASILVRLVLTKLKLTRQK